MPINKSNVSTKKLLKNIRINLYGFTAFWEKNDWEL